MKKHDINLLLNDFLETRELESCYAQKLDIALENVKDRNLGSAFNTIDDIFHDEFLAIPKIENEMVLFRFTGFPLLKGKWNGEKCPIISDIKNNAITLSSPKDFNDPMDPIIRAWIDKRMKEHCDNDDRILYELIKKAVNNVRIGCLVDPYIRYQRRPKIKPSINDCNQLMWSHYAKNHKGICIQYKVKLSNITDSDKGVVRLIEVDYNKPFPLDGSISFIDSLRVKGCIWSYENEVRLVYYSYHPDKYVQLPNYEIEAVYMGYKIDYRKRDFITNMLKGSNIKLYQMEFSPDNITKLEPIEIKVK